MAFRSAALASSTPNGFSNTNAVPTGNHICPSAAHALAVTAGGNAK